MNELTKKIAMKESSKQPEQDRLNVELANKHSLFTFTHRPYTYKGYETANAGKSIADIKIGEKYMVADRECESHYIVELMTFISICSKKKDYYSKNLLLFKDDAGDYWLVKPTIKIDNHHGDAEIAIEFEGKNIGKDLNKKFIEKEEVSSTLEIHNK